MKNISKHTFALIALFFVFGSSYAQEGKLKRAQQKFDGYAYVDAREIYLNVIEKGYSSPEVLKKLGDSYYFTADYRDAVKWYAQLVDADTGIDSEYIFRYAQALKSIQRYEESDKMMAQFEKATAGDSRGDMFVKERDYLDLIEKQSGRYNIKRLNFNSKYQDFSPAYFGERIVFSSNRTEDEGNVLIHDWNDQPFLDLYIVDTENGTEPRKLEGKVNTQYHESSTVFNKIGDVMYFTRNNFTKRKFRQDGDGTNRLKLYKSQRENGEWGEAEELPFNSDNYSTAHPALSPDGRKLYFASDMPGTKGQSDIWRVEILANGGYGEPENLGDNINTEGRDTFPFISDEGKLFFATDGHVGLGGLDIFVAKIDEDGTVGESFNVGKPVNSSADDFGLILNESKGSGYFSSSRSTGEGNDDIYAFSRMEELIVECSQNISGITKDLKTDEILPGARVMLKDNLNQMIAQTVSDVQGNYTFENVSCNGLYVVRAEKEEYDPAEVTLRTDNEIGRTVGRDLYLNPPVKIEVGDDLALTLDLNPIYFDLDKDFIRPDAAAELEKVVAVMRQFPNLKIDVRSHTDSRSSDAYNLALSKRRNTSTIDYIIRQGILQSRLTGDGYGETRLTNRCGNGVQCSEAEHQLNRRSEFIVVDK